MREWALMYITIKSSAHDEPIPTKRNKLSNSRIRTQMNLIYKDRAKNTHIAIFVFDNKLWG